MSNAQEKPATGATRRTRKPGQAAEKQKPIAYVNWRLPDADGETVIRSTRGFSLFDNEYLTLEDKALVQLAKDNGGTVIVQAEFRITVAQEKPETLDTSKVQLVQK